MIHDDFIYSHYTKHKKSMVAETGNFDNNLPQRDLTWRKNTFPFSEPLANKPSKHGGTPKKNREGDVLLQLATGMRVFNDQYSSHVLDFLETIKSVDPKLNERFYRGTLKLRTALETYLPNYQDLPVEFIIRALRANLGGLSTTRKHQLETLRSELNDFMFNRASAQIHKGSHTDAHITINILERLNPEASKDDRFAEFGGVTMLMENVRQQMHAPPNQPNRNQDAA